MRKGTISLQLRSARFRNPVLIDLLTGAVYALAQTADKISGSFFDALPIADYPLIIVEKDEILIAKK